MGTREIQSPEDGVETPTVLDGNSNSIHGKKLGIYFIESDDRRTAFGRGYTGGTTPVNIHGKPIPDLSKTGGWIAAFFIFGNEMAERMAYFGLSVNMVAFMFYVMHRPFSSSSNVVNNFLGISQASSVLGGFLADAYLGRYWTIAIFTTIYLAGLTGITLCATMSIFVPNQDNCDQLSLLLGNCEPAKQWQMVYLYAVLYVTAFGAAGIRPCVSSFGADQFDESRPDYKSLLDRFFNFFYLSVTIGAILAFTAVVYIQIKHGWGAAFGSLAAAMGISNMVFFIGTPLYRHRLPGGSPLTRVAQVLVAAFRKRNNSFSSGELIGLYEVPGKQSAIRGSGKIAHTDDFRCLDRAALQLKEDGPNPSPWRLCTVTQVEEVKILLKLTSVCSVTLSQRHGISLRLPRFLFVISLIFTVLIPDISWVERCLVMTLIGICYLLLEILPRIKESSLLNRRISSITPTCRYKNSISFISVQAINLLTFTSLILNISSAERPIFKWMIGSFIFSIDLFPEYMERYLVNRSSIVTLNFGLDSNDWSQLHIDFVSEIVNRLHGFEDVMAATGVSRTWRSACFATTITRSHQLPWLMLSETPHTHRRRFFSLLNKNRYQLPLSKALCGKRCWGSQHNWVVALGPDYRAHLVPLVRGEPIALPPLDTIRGDAPEEWFRLAHKFILFKDPSHDHEQSFLVFAIYSPMNCLAFARVGEGAALNRRGQDEWVTVTDAGNLRFKDVACLDNQVYGLCDEGALVRIELDAPLLPEVQVIASHQPDVREPRQLYLVESLGKLYMVFRYGYLIPSQRRHVTTSFLVYMFNFSALAFEEVRDLEGHAFFVGDGNSWSIPTSTIPAVTNRIYFTDDHWDWPMYLGGAYGGCDLGGFNMANRFMQSLPFGKVSPPSHSRPILVTPPIRLD